MPMLEQKALQLTKGRVLDIGAKQRLPYARLAGEGLGGKSH